MFHEPLPTSPGGLSAQDREELLQTARRLLAEAQALSSRIAAINEIATAINQALRLEEILRVVGKQAKWLLDFNHCSVYLRQPDGSWQLLPLFGPTVETELGDLLGEDNLIAKALNSRYPQVAHEGSTVPFLHPYASQIIVPLLSGQQTLGTINFAATEPHAYSQEDLRIGYLLALQLSTALLNASRLLEAEQRLVRLQGFQTASRQISGAVEMNQLFYLLTRLFLQSGRFDSLSLGIFEGNDLHLHPTMRATKEATRPSLPPLSLAVDEPLVRHLLESQGPFVQEGMSESDGTRTRLALPLLQSDGNLYGALLLDSRQPYSGDDEYLLLLQSFADQVAVTITNIELYQQVQRLLHTYMPGTVVTSLLANPTLTDLGGQEQVVTVLFADLANFTSFSEHHEPGTVLGLLNHCFQAATEAILEQHGIVDKFLGDGVMALFNVPTPLGDHAGAAIRAACQLQARIAATPALAGHRFTIGIHTGTAIVGNVGSNQQRSFTAIGDAVNTAKRLEEMAIPGQVLVSAATLRASQDSFAALSLGVVALKGKAQTLEVFEIGEPC